MKVDASLLVLQIFKSCFGLQARWFAMYEIVPPAVDSVGVYSKL